MGLCMKANCTSKRLCSKCRKLYPVTAAGNDRARREQGGGNRSGGGQDVGRFAEGIVTAVTAFSGLNAPPPVDQVYNAGDAYDQSRSSVVDNRDEYLDEQTRAANNRKGSSSGH